MSYQPPVEIEYGPQRSIKGGIDEAVMLTIEQTLNIKVDKDELIRAMRYDRQQYEKGYADGAAQINRAEILRLCNEIELIVCEIYNTGHMMQNCDYKEILNRVQRIGKELGTHAAE